jgi:methylmalonyl-CoA mutase N-terminal domain/subunit
LRTQQIIASETGVANTVDPLGGSYTIETLTNEIESGATRILERIEQTGGTLAAIEAGLIQREIQESAYRAQVAIDAGESTVVGVNRFADGTSSSGSLFQMNPEVERQQIEHVRKVRANRNEAAWRRALAAVSDAATSGRNLVPAVIDAVEAYATVGEIADSMRAVFGEHEDTTAV